MTTPENITRRKQIGTVKINRVRVYQLDPMVRPGEPVQSSVLVQPGEYPVYLKGISYYWQMTGVLNEANQEMGDGMFRIDFKDVLSEDEVMFYSQRFGPDEWKDLLKYYSETSKPALTFLITNDK